MRRDAVARTVVSLVVLGACAFVLVSVATFSKDDLPAFHLPSSEPMHNCGGIVGAHVAGFLLQSVGACVWVVVIPRSTWSPLPAVWARSTCSARKTVRSR